MKNFIIALQFLTRISIRPNLEVTEKDMVTSAAMYPLVGFVLGLLLLLFVTLSSRLLGFPPFLIAVLVVVAEIALTGGLHLDGLMDCGDGLLSYLPKERMLAIMKDSRVGANAVLVVVSLLLVKVALLTHLLPSYSWLVVGMTLFSRWTLLYLARYFPYGGQEGSLGGTVIGKVSLQDFLLGTGHSIAASFLFGFIYSLLFKQQTFIMLSLLGLSWLAAGCGAYRLATKSCEKIDGITGDVLGAVLEITEVVVLFVGAVVVSFIS